RARKRQGGRGVTSVRSEDAKWSSWPPSPVPPEASRMLVAPHFVRKKSPSWSPPSPPEGRLGRHCFYLLCSRLRLACCLLQKGHCGELTCRFARNFGAHHHGDSFVRRF